MEDNRLLRHTHQITEMLASDEASAELPAADVCRGRRGCDEVATRPWRCAGRRLAYCARQDAFRRICTSEMRE